MSNTMRAVVLEKPCTAEELKISTVPIPVVKPGWVLVKIEAFGINRSEIFTRNGQSPSVVLPRIIGIECVGTVANPSDSTLRQGQRVVSMMGGLGRDFDGGYAEYALVPASQVYPVESELPWPQFAALPEMYYTAWCTVVDTLKLAQGETLLIRGGTSSVGLAAMQLAKAMGARVAATTRCPKKVELLLQRGADVVLVDDKALEQRAKAALPQGADKVLELVGTVSLKSSFALLAKGGILCFTGILGGAWEIEHFAPMEFIPSGSYFTIYDSQNVKRASLDAMFRFIQENDIQPPIARVFSLEDIGEAHKLMEFGTANGKLVATTG